MSDLSGGADESGSGLIPPPVPADAEAVERVDDVDGEPEAEPSFAVPPLPAEGGFGRIAARERALGLLYESLAKAVEPSVLLADLPIPADPFAVYLVEGVAARQDVIDEHLERVSHRWDLHRMPTLDLLILRIGVFELLESRETPVPVVINEAVELAKQFSTDDSSRFVNGVLNRLGAELR